MLKELSQWSGAQPPRPVTIAGRWVTLEPLSAERHGHDLWGAVDGHDEVWTWLSDGPYAREEELAAALSVKETGTGAQFFAILPKHSERAAGYASRSEEHTSELQSQS